MMNQQAVLPRHHDQFPGIKGFNRRGLYRMKQFYETYAGNKKVAPLVTPCSGTNQLLIMSGSKSDEEREFYLRLTVNERHSKRQLERQIDSGYYERYMLSKTKLLPESLQQQNPFLDSCWLNFLTCQTHSMRMIFAGLWLKECDILFWN